MPSIKNLWASVKLHLPATRGMVEEVKAELMKRDNELAEEIKDVRNELNLKIQAVANQVSGMKCELSDVRIQAKLEAVHQALEVEKRLQEQILSLQAQIAKLNKRVLELMIKDGIGAVDLEEEEDDTVTPETTNSVQEDGAVSIAVEEETASSEEDDAVVFAAEEDEADDDGVAIVEDTSYSSVEEDPENPILGADDSFYDEFFDKGEFSIVEDEPAEVKEINVIKKKK